MDGVKTLVECKSCGKRTNVNAEAFREKGSSLKCKCGGDFIGQLLPILSKGAFVSSLSTDIEKIRERTMSQLFIPLRLKDLRKYLNVD